MQAVPAASPLWYGIGTLGNLPSEIRSLAVSLHWRSILRILLDRSWRRDGHEDVQLVYFLALLLLSIDPSRCSQRTCPHWMATTSASTVSESRLTSESSRVSIGNLPHLTAMSFAHRHVEV